MFISNLNFITVLPPVFHKQGIKCCLVLFHTVLSFLGLLRKQNKYKCIDRKIKCPLFGFILGIQDLDKSCFISSK